MKKISLYLPLFRFVAEEFANKLIEIDTKEDIEVWFNCPGGNVFAGWGIIGPIADRKGKKNAKVYGDASSMALYALLFFDYVEAIDVSTLVLHRADGEIRDESDREFLSQINKQLRAKLEMKVNPEVFKKVTGYTIDDVFSMERRLDIPLSASDAKKIGIVDKVIRIEAGTKEAKVLSENFVAFIDSEDSAPRGSGVEEITEDITRGSVTATKSTTEKNNNKIPKKMTKEEFKAQHPDLYASVYNDGVAAGKTAGAEQEFDRVSAFLEFADIDAEAVKKAIEEKKPMTSKFMAEMTKKSIAASRITDTKEETTEAIVTEKGPEAEKKAQGEKTAAQKEYDDLEAEIDKHMGFATTSKVTAEV